MKSIGTYMKTEVISITTETTVREAIRTCLRHHIGTLPVVNAERVLVGVVTISDLIGLGMPDFLQFMDRIEFIHTFGAMELAYPPAMVLDQPVSNLMNEPVEVEEHAGLLRASALLYKYKLLDLPVVDENQHLVGIVSRVDVGTALLEDWINEDKE